MLLLSLRSSPNPFGDSLLSSQPPLQHPLLHNPPIRVPPEAVRHQGPRQDGGEALLDGDQAANGGDQDGQETHDAHFEWEPTNEEGEEAGEGGEG